MAEPTKELFKFAFFSKFEENISFLSKLADPEKWDFGTNKNFEKLFRVYIPKIAR